MYLVAPNSYAGIKNADRWFTVRLIDRYDVHIIVSNHESFMINIHTNIDHATVRLNFNARQISNG